MEHNNNDESNNNFEATGGIEETEINWDNTSGEIQGIDDPNTDSNIIENIINEDDAITKEDEIKEDKEKKKKEEETTTEEEPETENDEETEEDNDEETEGDKKSNYDYALRLKEAGILDEDDLPKDKTELTTEELIEVQEKTFEKRLDEQIKNLFESLDEQGISYIKFIKNGGKTEDFIDIFVNQALPEIDINDKESHEEIVRFYLESRGEEDIDDQIEFLKENNKLETKAKTYYAKLKAEDNKRKEELLTKQQEENSKRITKAKEFYNNVKETLQNIEELNGRKITVKERNIILDSLSKTDKTSKRTSFQSKLAEVMNNPEKLIKLVDALNNDFNNTSTKNKTTTGNKIRKPNTTRNFQKQTRALADYFTDK